MLAAVSTSNVEGSYARNEIIHVVGSCNRGHESGVLVESVITQGFPRPLRCAKVDGKWRRITSGYKTSVLNYYLNPEEPTQFFLDPLVVTIFD